MSDFYDLITEGYDDVEAAPVGSTALPSGWYPLKIAKVHEVRESREGNAIMARVQLAVLEGPLANRNAFVNVMLGPSSLGKDKKPRSAEELKKAADAVKGQMKRFMTALGLSKGEATGTGLDKVSSFYRVSEWEGKEFMGKVKLVAATERYEESNALNDCCPLDDAKYGIEKFRARPVATAGHDEAAVTI